MTNMVNLFRLIGQLLCLHKNTMIRREYGVLYCECPDCGWSSVGVNTRD